MKIYSKKLQAYNSLESIPAYNYLKVTLEGDFSYLVKNHVKNHSAKYFAAIQEAYMNLITQIHEWRGLDRKERVMASMKLKALKHMQKAILTGNANDRIFAKIEIAKIDKLQGEGEKVGVYDAIFSHNKGMGYHTDAKIISAKEFISNIDNLTKINGESNK